MTVTQSADPEDIAQELKLPVRTVKRCVKTHKFNIQTKARCYFSEVGDKAIATSVNIVNKAHDISRRELITVLPEETRFQEKQGLPTVNKVMDAIIGPEKTQPVYINQLYQQNKVEINPVVQQLLVGIGSKLTDPDVIKGEECSTHQE
jgi:hypothetical protein